MAGKITQNELHNTLNSKINKLDNFSEDENGNLLYKGEKIASDSVTNGIYKEVANLNLQLEASKRVANGVTFGIAGDIQFGAEIDLTKTTSNQPLPAGTTVLSDKIDYVNGVFKAGQKVTVLDDVNQEEVTITKFVDNSVTNTYNIADATVVASPYDTSGNGGDKLVRLSNGWLVAGVKNGRTEIRFYVYKPNNPNPSWQPLCYKTCDAYDFSLVSKGTVVYVLITDSTTDYVSYAYFDATTVMNANINSYNIELQDTLLRCSLTINSTGTELHGAWSSINSTITSPYNVRYARGIINENGSVTWDIIEQVTSYSSSSYTYFAIEPKILLINNVPAIIVAQIDLNLLNASTGGYGGITILKRDSTLTTNSYVHSNWTFKNIYTTNSSSYDQHCPSGCVDNNGRIWVVWSGMDSTDTSKDNIRISYSDDGGKTWSTMQKLTTGNSYYQSFPVITVDKNNNIYVLYNGGTSYNGSSGYYSVMMMKYNGTSWGTPITVANGTTGHKQYPSVLHDITLDVTMPLFIYWDNQGSKVGFYGTWTEETVAYDFEISPLVNSYKENALIARSTVEIDEKDHFIKFGSWNGYTVTLQ